jgi:hypothetical protein
MKSSKFLKKYISEKLTKEIKNVLSIPKEKEISHLSEYSNFFQQFSSFLEQSYKLEDAYSKGSLEYSIYEKLRNEVYQNITSITPIVKNGILSLFYEINMLKKNIIELSNELKLIEGKMLIGALNFEEYNSKSNYIKNKINLLNQQLDILNNAWKTLIDSLDDKEAYEKLKEAYPKILKVISSIEEDITKIMTEYKVSRTEAIIIIFLQHFNIIPINKLKYDKAIEAFNKISELIKKYYSIEVSSLISIREDKEPTQVYKEEEYGTQIYGIENGTIPYKKKKRE